MKRTLRIPPLVLRVFCVALLIACAAFSWATMYHVSGTLLDSDASSNLVYANLLVEKGQLFLSPDWAYSTELNIPGPELAFSPLFAICQDWSTVRFAGTVLLHVMLLAAYAFLARQARMSLNSYCVTASAMLLPFSVAYGRIVLYHTYYVVTFIHAFLIVGLYLSMMRKSSKPVFTWIRGTLLIVLSFIAGLPSVRLLMIVTFPLAVSAVVLAILRERGSGEEPKAVFLRSLPQLGWALGSLAASVVGYLVNTMVLMNKFSVQDYSSLYIDLPGSSDFFSNLYNIFHSLLQDLGFDFGAQLFSMTGLISVGALALLAAMLILGLHIIRSSTDDAARFMQLFAIMALLTTVMAFLFLSGNFLYSLYLLPVILWFMPALGKMDICQPAEPEKTDLVSTALGQQGPAFTLHKALAMALCVPLLVSGVVHASFFRDPEASSFEYDGLFYTDTDTVARLSEVADYVKTEGYTLGYASYWNANVITELTDGKVKMTSLTWNSDAGQAITFHNWLTDMSLHAPEVIAQNKVFILMNIEEKWAFDSIPSLAEGSHSVLETDEYSVLAFDDPLVLLRYLNGEDASEEYEEDEW